MNLKNWYSSQFPESLFPCQEELLEEYKRRILIGCEIAEKSKVGIIKINEGNNVARNERLSQMFSSCDFFVNGEKYDFIFIIDATVIGGWSYDGILNSLGWSDIWDAIGSNSIKYDIENEKKIFYDYINFRRLN